MTCFIDARYDLSLFAGAAMAGGQHYHKDRRVISPLSTLRRVLGAPEGETVPNYAVQFWLSTSSHWPYGLDTSEERPHRMIIFERGSKSYDGDTQNGPAIKADPPKPAPFENPIPLQAAPKLG